MSLPEIPVIETGPDFPIATLRAQRERAEALLDAATRGVPRRALATLDAISRRWLVKSDNPALAEIDAIARLLGRPGAYFLAINYEWGCTTAVMPAPEGGSARLVRVLDWRTPGLGRYVTAARVAGPAGPFVTMTWPGYTGVLQAMAPGRFAAALNQAPMARAGGGLYPLDWFANRVRVWRMAHDTPGHVLRHVFEEARDFDEARRMLQETPISTPAIFALAGVRPHETCIIERRETEARCYLGEGAIANAWRTPGWHGRPRGAANAERACAMVRSHGALDGSFAWLTSPVLNPTTRLAVVADASRAAIDVRGYEAMVPATEILRLRVERVHGC